METTEIWGIHPEYTQYRISSFGKVVKANWDGSFRLLCSKPRRAGYIVSRITRDRDKKTVNMTNHRLVVETFIPNPEGKSLIDHINGIRTDNRVENLRWATSSENKINTNILSKGNSRKVVQFNQQGQYTHTWENVLGITKYFHIHSQDVKRACTNGNLLQGSYWRYFDLLPIEGEEWKPISVYGTVIYVSSIGRVTKSKRITYGSKENTGYLQTMIRKKTVLVHRLVCQAFKPIQNPDQYHVNHIDFNKQNNNVSNLEWVTRIENMHHYQSVRTGLKIQRPVAQHDGRGELLAFYYTVKDAAMYMGCKPSSIINVCDGRNFTYKGYKWVYTNFN